MNQTEAELGELSRLQLCKDIFLWWQIFSLGAGEMAQRVKELAPKSDGPSSILWTHMVGEN